MLRIPSRMRSQPSIMNIWYFHVTLHGPRRNGNREKNKLKESPWKYIMRLFNCTVNVSINQSTVIQVCALEIIYPSECTLSLLLLRGTESFVDSNMAKDNFCKLYNPWKPDKENCPNGSLTPLSCLCEL